MNRTCEICKSENVTEGIDWFDEGDQITRTQYECLDCGWKWDEPPFPDKGYETCSVCHQMAFRNDVCEWCGFGEYEQGESHE